MNRKILNFRRVSSQQVFCRHRVKREANQSAYEDEYYDDSYEILDEDTRIVNGYNADKRPWFVLLYIGKAAQAACGGALINDKFAVTAAHCFCRADSSPIQCDTSIVDGKPTSHPIYQVAEHVKIWVGVNDLPLDMLQRFPNMEYRGVNVKHVFQKY